MTPPLPAPGPGEKESVIARQRAEHLAEVDQTAAATLDRSTETHLKLLSMPIKPTVHLRRLLGLVSRQSSIDG